MKTENVQNKEVYSESLARDEMDDETFNAMLERGLREAMEGDSCAVSEVFRKIRQDVR